MMLLVLFEKFMNLVLYYLLLYVACWSELDTLSWLARRRGWAWIFPNKLIVVDAHIAHEILVRHSTSHFSKAPVNNESPLSASMLNNSQRRPDSRHTLLQCLSPKQIINIYVPIMQECTQHLINQWKSTLTLNNSVVDVTDACTRLTLDIVGQTLLGGTFGACVHEEDGNQLTHCILMLTREKFTKNNNGNHNSCSNGIDEIKFIDDLIHRRWIDSEQALDFDNTKLVLFAGSETTGTALALTLLTLAHRKDIQTMLRDQSMRQVNLEIEGNTLLDSFIREILRFWTIAPFITRRCTHDLDLQIGPQQTLLIPRESNVNIFTWSIHRSPVYYTRPDEFDLTRTSPNKRCYLPFSIGSRMCPGMEFAITELKVIVTLLLQYFEFEPSISLSTFDNDRVLAQQQFHIDWHHSVLHTQHHLYLKLRDLA
jgi:cytochrome P450